MNGILIGIIVVAAVLLLARAMGGSNAAAAKAKLAQGAVVIDVRTEAEFAAGHYQGARNIPLNELQGRMAELGDKQQPIVVYCASGMRSASAVKILKAHGFADVTNAGGLSNLR